MMAFQHSSSGSLEIDKRAGSMEVRRSIPGLEVNRGPSAVAPPTKRTLSKRFWILVSVAIVLVAGAIGSSVAGAIVMRRAAEARNNNSSSTDGGRVLNSTDATTRYDSSQSSWLISLLSHQKPTLTPSPPSI